MMRRIALITGSTGGGMGRSIAFTLAKNGCDIILNYGTGKKDAEADNRAKPVAEAIQNMGRRVLLVKADTTDYEEVASMVKKGVDHFGRIDILVNNAGGLWNPQDITEILPEQFQKVIEAEINGAFYCIRECLPVMRENKWGRIITIGVYGAGHWAAEEFGPVEYAIGKGGRALLTKHLALRERKYNITVNLINPGPGHTAHVDMEAALSFIKHGTHWKSRTKATPQDIAEAVLFLCTEQARFITGSYITFSVE